MQNESKTVGPFWPLLELIVVGVAGLDGFSTVVVAVIVTMSPS